MEKIRDIVLKDWRLKVLSLVLACILWFATTYLGDTRMTISVPVQLQNLEQGLIVKSIDTRHLVVTVTGPLSTLKSMKSDEIKTTIDLSRAKQGRQTYMVRKSDIWIPKGAGVESVRPDYVVIELDKVVEKSLPLIVLLGEKWAGNYRIESWTPHHVSLQGSEESLAQVASIRTVPIEGPFEGDRETVGATLDTRHLLLKRVQPESIKVTVRRIGK